MCCSPPSAADPFTRRAVTLAPDILWPTLGRVTAKRSAAVKRSAGILLFRRTARGIEVLLGHSGGPFYANRDAGAWSIPKGEYGPDERPFDAACREFAEELGLPVPAGEPRPLGDVVQKNRKIVTAWAVEGDLDPADISPGTFSMEWPPGTGRMQQFPEIDRVAWFSLAEASDRMIARQQGFLPRLEEVADATG